MRKILVLIFSIITVLALSIHFFGLQIGLALFDKPLYIVPPSVYRLTKDALTIMENYGVYAKETGFEKEIPNYLAQIKKDDSFDDVVPMLNHAIKQAGGEHSALIEVQEDDSTLFNPALLTFPRVLIEDNIATLFLPSFPASDEENVHTYITTTLEQLSNMSDLQGVIIDLRGNHGGNMMPMLGACAPFLKEGKLFEFISPNKKIPVFKKDGEIRFEENRLSLPANADFHNLPIAVLIDHQTASSAEVLLIALLGQERVSTFGEETAGYATGVSMIPLYGKYALSLAGAKIKGTNGILYEEKPILPDVITDHPEKAALEWLEGNE
jgi:carboxyl-terminal processing protease